MSNSSHIGDQIFNGFNYVTGDIQADSAADKGGYRTKSVPLALLDAHPENRKIHNELVEKYAESIKREGLAHPPLVRKLADGRYQIISGHHRALAYQQLNNAFPKDGWDMIPVTIKSECDDKQALRLLSVTNVRNPEITEEERGKMLSALGEAIDELRAAQPEAMKGVRTNDALAELTQVSARTVARSKAAYKQQQDPNHKPVSFKKPEHEKVLDALERDITRAEKLFEAGKFNPEWFDISITRMRRMQRRHTDA